MKHIILAASIALALASCSDSFLEEKKNYDNASVDSYNYFSGANARLNDIYAWCLPDATAMTWKYPSCGYSDDAGKSTEEYAGFSAFVDPTYELSSTSTTHAVPDFFMGDKSNIQAAVYGRIRNINDFFEGVANSTLKQEEKDLLVGQAKFFRAWCYYNLMKWYGGVPIVDKKLEPAESSFTPRSSAKAVYEFILADLKDAAEKLRSHTTHGGWSGSDYGRVTTGTALALKGRVMALWCSPLFNRADDKARWEQAYTEMKADLADIDACGYGLYANGGSTNGSNFAKAFCQAGRNPEAVFVTLFNNIVGDGLDTQKNNPWERGIRPKNTGGSGMKPSQMLIDIFPMADGKVPATADTYTKLGKSDINYDNMLPFVKRDPRFYRTFAFPGYRWTYAGDASTISAANPSDGGNYELWNYVWYTNADLQASPESSESYGADNLLKDCCGVYVRKKSDDKDINGSPLYQYKAEPAKGAYPFFSAAQLIELRYAEVLLNLAEVSCGAGHADEAVSLIAKIRERAGYKAADNYGLDASLASDRAACMSAILYERQIEFAYEGKRFDDMRRWMLFDGGATQVSGAPATWTLTGFGGNTCTWLGVKPMNGQRRELIQFRVADQYGLGGTAYNADPAKDGDPLRKAGVARCKAVNLTKALDAQNDVLAQWYKDNLVMKQIQGDGHDSQHALQYCNFRPNYYFLGLTSTAATNNAGLPQTIGWADYNTGGQGTFDPLAE